MRRDLTGYDAKSSDQKTQFANKLVSNRQKNSEPQNRKERRALKKIRRIRSKDQAT